MSRINQSIPHWDGKQWRYRPVIDGKQRDYRSSKAGPRGAAECKRKADLARANVLDLSASKVGQLWPKFEAHIAQTQGEHCDTLRQAKSCGKNHILPKTKHRQVMTMTGADWQDVLNQAKPVKRQYKTTTATLTQTTNGELSAKTIKNIRGIIVAFLDYCAFVGLSVPRASLRVPLRRERVGKAVLSPAELERLLALDFDATGDVFIYAFQFQALTGLRPGEVIAFKESDIEGDYYTITQSLNDKAELTEGKNKNARRRGYIFPALREVIDKQRALKRTRRKITPWLFCNHLGGIATQEQYRNHLKALCKKQGWTKITPYALRHNFTSAMAAKLPVDLIKIVLGHSATMDTLGVYNAQQDDYLKAVGEAVNKVWLSKTRENLGISEK